MNRAPKDRGRLDRLWYRVRYEAMEAWCPTESGVYAGVCISSQRFWKQHKKHGTYMIRAETGEYASIET